MKSFIEYQIYTDSIEYPNLIAENKLLKYETKEKVDRKEEVKEERVSCLNPKSKGKSSYQKSE